MKAPQYNAEELERRIGALTAPFGAYAGFTSALHRIGHYMYANIYAEPGYTGSERLFGTNGAYYQNMLSAGGALHGKSCNSELVQYRPKRQYQVTSIPKEFLDDLSGGKAIFYTGEAAWENAFNAFDEAIKGQKKTEDIAKALADGMGQHIKNPQGRRSFKALYNLDDLKLCHSAFFQEDLLSPKEILGYMPEEIKSWMKKNATQIPEADQTLINSEIERYEHYYNEIKGCAQYAGLYLAHLKKKAPDRSVDV